MVFCLKVSMYPRTGCLGLWIIGLIAKVLGTYMNIGYLDPYGSSYSFYSV